MANQSTTKFNDLSNPSELKAKDLGAVPAEHSRKESESSFRGGIDEMLKSTHLNELKDKAKEGATAVLEKGREIAGQVEDAASEYAGSAANYVKRYPVQSILVGFGAGLLVGALIIGSRRSA